ncbi:NADH dehydrogenase [ubiquinone] iron-sulfur 5 [Brachionus plicatilis]|uniref:NADH dehydrogenase [ubiquinone] iron-sulfur 5 n=1 Tax=Brachionus plicatilis TaxID=10195 RepID=A0A3M7SBG4_BRAPC|nr:NADH dehydrogenase [ubiquinone] iron-sulfur 5 [Brachionus plicatilis]
MEDFGKKMEQVVPVQTPLTYNFAWVNSHGGRRCEIFEKQWLDCASKLGLYKAEKVCKFELQDLKECERMDIAYKRYMRMQEERQKKGLPYQDPPPYDTLPYQKFKTVVF